MVSLKIAIRNLRLHKVKTTVVGLIILFGTVLAVVGNSLVDSIAEGMRNSLTHSVTGDIQIYSKSAKDKISVFGNMEGGLPDIGHVADFGKVKKTLLEKVPNVKAVVPMGTNYALFNPGNNLDVKLEELRAAYKKKDWKAFGILKEHVRAISADIARSFRENADNRAYLQSNPDFKDADQNIAMVMSEGFWASFDTRAEERMEFLANRIAPLLFDDTMLYFSYIGTVPQSFQETFPLMEVVKGQAIPTGKRGILLSDFVYETMFKHRIARRLDQIEKRKRKDGVTIALEKELKDAVNANVSQAAELYTQLAPARARELVQPLQALLKSNKRDIQGLIHDFLQMEDANFAERFAFFYKEIAPHIVLYRVRIGDLFPVTAFTKLGTSASVNVRIHGTFRFKSFESSPIAGNFSLLDLVSFRELYGFMTDERRQETKQLEAEMQISDGGRDDVEALFGVAGAPAKESANPAPVKNTLASLNLGGKRGLSEDVSMAEMESGVFLSAAVVLKDPSRLEATIAEIRRVGDEQGLGIQAVDWKEAAGFVGQLTLVVRGVLYAMVTVVFAMAAFIITNSLLMATMERSREIGTMRAIGAQKRFIFALFLQEALGISLIFGAIGSALGVAIVWLLGRSGIPAKGDVATFFFSGDRLYPSFNPMHIGIIFLCIVLITVIATQIPAWKAMRISPLQAMQKNE